MKAVEYYRKNIPQFFKAQETLDAYRLAEDDSLAVSP